MVDYSYWNEQLSKTEDSLYEIVQGRKNNNDFIGALELIKELHDGRPDSILFNVVLANVYEILSKKENDTGKMVLAEKHYKIGVDSAPKSSLISGFYFHCLWSLGKGSEAINEMKRFKAVGNPDDYRELEKDYRDEIEAELRSESL